jgi:hypothetical protein
MQPLEIAPRPENFPLGSPKSRAAARAMLRRIQADREQPVVVFTVEYIGSTEPNQTIEVYAQTKRENQ